MRLIRSVVAVLEQSIDDDNIRSACLFNAIGILLKGNFALVVSMIVCAIATGASISCKCSINLAASFVSTRLSVKTTQLGNNVEFCVYVPTSCPKPNRIVNAFVDTNRSRSFRYALQSIVDPSRMLSSIPEMEVIHRPTNSSLHIFCVHSQSVPIVVHTKGKNRAPSNCESIEHSDSLKDTRTRIRPRPFQRLRSKAPHQETNQNALSTATSPALQTSDIVFVTSLVDTLLGAPSYDTKSSRAHTCLQT